LSVDKTNQMQKMAVIQMQTLAPVLKANSHITEFNF